MYKNVVVIPALNPPASLKSYVESLIMAGMENILIVNDGSRSEYIELFNELEKNKEVKVFHHAKNLGKGRALKNAMNYVLSCSGNDFKGIITADSDGQHTVEDVVQLQKLLDKQAEPAMILGTRDFNEEEVPFKSRYGNKITSVVFWLLYGKKIKDTQTGLRAIPKELMYEYMDLQGERFEYEMNMLIYSAVHKQKIEQQDIKTVYFDNNSETHFKPVSDSLKIYGLIFRGFFKYILSSVSASLIDIGIFYLLISFLTFKKESMAIVVATVVARVISSLYNFTVNRNLVFQTQGSTIKHMVKYYTLCFVQMMLSAGFVVLLHTLLEQNETFEKIIVDCILFVFSYQIQRIWVFKEG